MKAKKFVRENKLIAYLVKETTFFSNLDLVRSIVINSAGNENYMETT
jgi:hypothetical protein